MPVAFDVAVGQGTAASVGEAEVGITIANVANRFAIMTTTTTPASDTTSAVTMGGLSFSLISTVAYSTSLQARTYVLYNPNTGSQSIRFALQRSTSFIFAVSVFNGVDQASGYSLQYTASGSAAAATATISTSTTDMVFAGLVIGSAMASSSASFTGATERLTFSTVSRRVEHHTHTPAGTTQTIAFAGVAGNSRLLVGMNIKASSTTPASVLKYQLPMQGVGQ